MRELKPSMIGKKFGRFTVIAEAPSDRNWQSRWKCVCDCGVEKTVLGTALRQGKTKSCGCLARENASHRVKARNVRHGMYGTREYQSYTHAKNRCSSPKSHAWANYGGRGIEFRFDSFEQFMSVMGPRPAGTSLDRFPDNNGNYEPGNVRWATAKQQASNRRTNLVVAA